jgi:parallel beta-helix repeat protein
MFFLQTLLAILCVSPPYQLGKPIKLENKSNITIERDTIDGGTLPCILLINCTNIHITHCKLINSKDIGIRLEGCSRILIDSNEIGNVKAGVFAIMCPSGGIRVLNNQMKNMQGPYPQADFIQFDRVSGANNQICYNRLENFQGESNAEDAINLYLSNGLPDDPILVAYNRIRGGGPGITGAGITAGDGGGSYQKIENNIVVNSGSGGIQVAGGTHIQIINNIIYSKSFPWSGFGLASSNYSGKPSDNNTVSYNKVNWIAGRLGGIRRDTVYKAGTGANVNALPAGWHTNTVDVQLSENVLPVKIIDF